MYWSSLWARILNVQDIRKEPRRQVKMYLDFNVYSFHHHRRCCQHSFIFCLRCTTELERNSSADVPRREDVSIPTILRFNVGPTSQPMAGSMLVNRLRRWPNINSESAVYFAQTRDIQCCFDVDPQSSMLARHCNSIGWLDRVFWLLHCYAGDAFRPGARNTR